MKQGEGGWQGFRGGKDGAVGFEGGGEAETELRASEGEKRRERRYLSKLCSHMLII